MSRNCVIPKKVGSSDAVAGEMRAILRLVGIPDAIAGEFPAPIGMYGID